MKKNLQIVKKLQQQLQKVGTEENRKIYSKYFKEKVEFRGVKSPQINEIYKETWGESKSKFDFVNKKDIAFNLIKSEFSEDKQLGILILKEITKEMETKDIDQVKKLILDGYLNNWGNIDSLCGKLLQDWTKISKDNTLYISQWSQQVDNLWVRRASCVTFVNRAKHPDTKKPNFKGFGDIMFKICQNTVIHNERFNQLGCGWLLRNLTLSHKKRALKFIEDHYQQFSREGLRYAIEKLDDKERKYYLNYQKIQIEQEEQSEEEEEQEQEENVQNLKKPKKSQIVKKKNKK